MTARLDPVAVLARYEQAYMAANKQTLRESGQRVSYERGWVKLQSARSSMVIARHRLGTIVEWTDRLRAVAASQAAQPRGAGAGGEGPSPAQGSRE